MKITIDTAYPLSLQDEAFLRLLLSILAPKDPAAETTPVEVNEEPSAETTPVEVNEKPTPVKRARKKAAPKAEETPEGPTLTDVVETATRLLQAGERAKVIAALKAVGAARVSEVPEDKVAEIYEALVG